MKAVKWNSLLVAIDINFYDHQYLTQVSSKWDVKKSRRRMGGVERVVRLITQEVRWDQSHLIPLLSHEGPKSYFAENRLTKSDVQDEKEMYLVTGDWFSGPQSGEALSMATGVLDVIGQFPINGPTDTPPTMGHFRESSYA